MWYDEWSGSRVNAQAKRNRDALKVTAANGRKEAGWIVGVEWKKERIE